MRIISAGARRCSGAVGRPDDLMMWVTPDRVFYFGLLGAPSERLMGSVTIYVAVEGSVRIRIGSGDWQDGAMAVAPPYAPHEVLAEQPLINVIKVEAETVDLLASPEILRRSGVVDAPDFVAHVRRQSLDLRLGRHADLRTLDFDSLFFEDRLPPRRIDRRIRLVIERIKSDPSAPAHAEDCARAINLSFSRFLHLFKQETGVPFRSFRSWKRARSFLHRANQRANLALVALDSGYPDSTHFSHSIRRTFGLKPKDIFAGSKRLAVFANELSSAHSSR
jgi:AraC-like DNA-binding protein